MGFWIGVAVVVVAAAALLALAWWSSGRSKSRFGGSSSAHEIAKGTGTLQGMTHNQPGEGGRGF